MNHRGIRPLPPQQTWLCVCGQPIAYRFSTTQGFWIHESSETADDARLEPSHEPKPAAEASASAPQPVEDPKESQS